MVFLYLSDKKGEYAQKGVKEFQTGVKELLVRLMLSCKY